MGFEIAALIVAILSAAAASRQSYLNASAQAEAQRQQYALNKTIAERNAFSQYIALERRRQEEDAVAAAALEKNAAAAEAARGSLRAAVAEGGGAGASARALLQDFRRTELGFASDVTRTKLFRDRQIDAEQRAAQLGAQSQILNSMPQPIPIPNYAVELLKIGAEGGRGANSIYQNNFA
jgi:hypothetical protein